MTITVSAGELSDSMTIFFVDSGPTSSFVDVISGKFYYDSALWAYYRDPQITNGTDPTHFSPNANCTRCQVASFLNRAYGAKG